MTWGAMVSNCAVYVVNIVLHHLKRGIFGVSLKYGEICKGKAGVELIWSRPSWRMLR